MKMIRDHFQNFKRYSIPKAQLIIADIPYNLGNNAYASNPVWYVDGDNKQGESDLAGTQFFDTDKDFRVPEFMHFASQMLKKEPRKTNDAGCMVVFCSFEQQFMLIQEAKKHGFNNYINLVFKKKTSAQVLKANMRVVGNCEYGIVLYRDKLPKFRNKDENGENRMIMNWMDYEQDNETPKIHPTQKSIHILKKLIGIFTDIGDVVIDPCAGSGTTLLAAEHLGRKSYGFEIKKEYVDAFHEKLANNVQISFDNLEAERIKLERRQMQWQV